MRSPILLAALASLAVAAPAAAAEFMTSYSTDASFEDVAFAVESGIVDRGLVVDYVSHVGEMLNRTAADVGAEKELFVDANIYLFCSAQLSRRAMEASLDNIAHCPYGIFVYHTAAEPDVTHVGYRKLPYPGMEDVQALLDEIAKEAAE